MAVINIEHDRKEFSCGLAKKGGSKREREAGAGQRSTIGRQTDCKSACKKEKEVEEG